MRMPHDSALLALANGELFWGSALGPAGCLVGEVVFNTAMTGYQEILTDPSYAKQIVCFTYPHIGNVGINEEDAESAIVYTAGVILREMPHAPSNFRASASFTTFLQDHNLMGIAGIDTRYLTQLLREQGSQIACMMTGPNIDPLHAIAMIKSYQSEKSTDLMQLVSTKIPFEWRQGSKDFSAPHSPFHVLVYDFGVKKSILKHLVDLGCQVTVVPPTFSAAKAVALQPHGIVLSNGPGDPNEYLESIAIIQLLLNTRIPLLGICLGHQLLALASGTRVIKMKFGHHGANHPIQCLKTKKVFITSQNHHFAVDETQLDQSFYITHRSLLDHSVQGIMHRHLPAMGFQGHPEGGPGPTDMAALFETYLAMLNHYKITAKNHSGCVYA